MALSSTALAALIKAKLLADPASAAQDNPALAALCAAVAEACVEHITTAAVVTVPPGVAVQVVVPAGTGATTAPGVGTVT